MEKEILLKLKVASVLYENGNKEKSLEHYMKARHLIDEHKDSIGAFVFLEACQVAKKLEKTSDQEAFLKRAKEKGFKTIDEYNAIIAHYAAEDGEDSVRMAIGHCKSALKIANNDNDRGLYYFRMARLSEKLEDDMSALLFYEKAYEHYLEDFDRGRGKPYAALCVAKCHVKAGVYDKAFEYFDIAYNLTIKYDKRICMLIMQICEPAAMAKEKVGDLDGAMFYLNSAFEITKRAEVDTYPVPWWPQSMQFLIAEMYERNGNQKQADETYKDILRNHERKLDIFLHAAHLGLKYNRPKFINVYYEKIADMYETKFNNLEKAKEWRQRVLAEK